MSNTIIKRISIQLFFIRIPLNNIVYKYSDVFPNKQFYLLTIKAGDLKKYNKVTISLGKKSILFKHDKNLLNYPNVRSSTKRYCQINCKNNFTRITVQT